MQKAAETSPVAAPTQAPPVAAAVAPVAEAPATAPAPSEDISSFRSYFSSLTETKPKEEAPKAPEQPKPLTAAELRAKRVAEVAQREREEAERKAAEQVNTPLSHLILLPVGRGFRQTDPPNVIEQHWYH